MFCPSCKDEFRAGFTRCANCEVDLVESLDAVVEESDDAPRQQPVVGNLPMRECGGYIDLDAAREARDVLVDGQVQCDIVIRVSPDSPPGGPVREEYHVRAAVPQHREALALLASHEPQDDGTIYGPAVYSCACGRIVTEEDTVCPGCGARLDD